MKKNKTVQFDLNGEIRLLLNRNIVKFVSRDGKWEMSFGEGTMEYAQIVYLISKKELTSLQNLASFLFFTKLIVSNVDFCNGYNDLLKKFLEDNEVKKEVDEKEDAKILAEEKALHEKTPEAVQELENTKKENNDE